jgi:multidrug transporter EmrE-like cation transporter
MEFPVWVWAVLASFVSTTYFFLIKYYITDRRSLILGAIVLLELLVIFLYFKSLESVQSGTMYAIINGISVIMGALIAVIFFREHFSYFDLFGIALIIIGILIVGPKKSVKI